MFSIILIKRYSGSWTKIEIDLIALHNRLLVCAGAIDALMLLDKHIAPGCVLLFDDLINYPNYRDHEILALWEWLQATGRKLEVTNSWH